MPTRKVVYGWVRDAPDHRDVVYSAPLERLTALPPKVDLRPACPAVYDQGQIGSCTANAIAGSVQFARMKEKRTNAFTPSRLFIYYNERDMEHTVALDNGAQLRDGLKSVSKVGVCPEKDWPYDDTPADPGTHLFPQGAQETKKPTGDAYADAKKCLAVSYQRINQTLSQLKGCLAEGFPFVFGFAVFSSWLGASGTPATVVPLPSASDSDEGGHAVMAVGYDDADGMFAFRNSWGTDVGDGGYFKIPYAYLLDNRLSSDFWTIRAMSS
jgi:C1A family cysteine protease